MMQFLLSFSLLFFTFFCSFETRSHYVAKIGLKLMASFLPQSPEYRADVCHHAWILVFII